MKLENINPVDLKVGDLFLLKKNIPFNIYSEDLNDLNVGILLGILEPDGSEEHQEIIFATYQTLQEIDDVDELINSRQYKIYFPRMDHYYWLPEHYVIQMFNKNI